MRRLAYALVHLAVAVVAVGVIAYVVAPETVAQQATLFLGRTTSGTQVPVQVDADGTLVSSATIQAVSEDATHSSGVGLFMTGCVRQDSLASLTSDDGDNAPCSADNMQRSRTRALLVDADDQELQLASEAATPSVWLDVDESEDEIDDDAGCLSAIFASNRDTANEVFVKVWLADADDVTVGTTAANMVYRIGPNREGNLLPSGICIAYTTGLTIAAVTDEATSASTGPDANEVVATVYTKD